jgi:hypothetical protein
MIFLRVSHIIFSIKDYEIKQDAQVWEWPLEALRAKVEKLEKYVFN